MGSQVSPWAWGTLQTPAPNSHQRIVFLLLEVSLALPGSSFSAWSTHSRLLQAMSLYRTWWFRSSKFLPQINFCNKMTFRSKGAEGSNKSLHREKFEEPGIAHKAGSHLVGQQLQQALCHLPKWHVFPSGAVPIRNLWQCHQLPICGGHMPGTLGLSARLPKQWAMHR